jgi:hypothetical protein
MTTQDFYIVNKVKNKHLIQNFENLVLYGHNNLIFDDLAQVIKKVFMVNLSKENWKDSKCTCKFYLKEYFCAHIIIVASSLTLATIPNHCKNINIGAKKKVGKPSNASKGITRQSYLKVLFNLLKKI